jgi:ATP-dependent RNA helicase RhlE
VDLLRSTTSEEEIMKPFEAFGMDAAINRALADLMYTTPTPIQSRALPVALAGHDLIACAQTGSGKTAVFALPFLQRLATTRRDQPRRRSSPRGLVLVPTRELAIQVSAAFRRYGQHLHVNTAAAYGGVGYGAQVSALRGGVDIVVATPGRLLDLLARGDVRLDQVQYLVIDEADRMLDLGFLPQVRRVMTDGRIPAQGRQTLLFSATMPQQIAALAQDYLTAPKRVEAQAPNSAVSTIEQRLYPVAPTQKGALLAHLLRSETVESAIVFVRTRRRADGLSRLLNRAGVRNEAIHGDVSQNQRERTLAAFRQGRLRVLVATDVASRGLDIPHLSHVVNYDVPNLAEDYVHRIGRTGRAGRAGLAITLYSRTDEALWQAVEKLSATKLEPMRAEGFAYEPDTSTPELTRRQRAEAVAAAAPKRVMRPAGGSPKAIPPVTKQALTVRIADPMGFRGSARA